MTVKVVYNKVSHHIQQVIEDGAVVVITDAENMVVCDKSLLDVHITNRIEIDPFGEETTVPTRDGYMFPTDLDKLKQIAIQTIDYWRKYKQAAGYIDEDGVGWSTSQESKTNMMGKLQEMMLLGLTECIFPDVNGAPAQLTMEQLQNVGLAIAAQTEAIYMTSVTNVNIILSSDIATLDQIQNLISDILGDIRNT